MSHAHMTQRMDAGIYPFNPKEDACVLRRAMKGAGTNEKQLIDLLTSRTEAQRQQILATYNALDFSSVGLKGLTGDKHRNLAKDFDSELSSVTEGKFKKALLAMLETSLDNDVACLHKATKGTGTKEDWLIEIICTRTKHQLDAIGARFKELHGQDLKEIVEKETDGDFQRLLLAVLSTPRNPDPQLQWYPQPYGIAYPPDMLAQQVEAHKRAKVDAKTLYDAGSAMLGTDENKMIEIFSRSSFYHLKNVFQHYALIENNDYGIIKGLKKELSGDFERAMVTIAEVAMGSHRFFGRRILKAMKGVGTDADSLTRLLISRADLDLWEINESFPTLEGSRGNTLVDWIKGDTSGDYENFLVALVSRSYVRRINLTTNHKQAYTPGHNEA